MTLSIAFVCKSCGEDASPIRSSGGIAGFDGCLGWLAPVPGPDPANPRVLEKAPVPGEEHRLAVRFPFHATAKERFWCLFRPPLSYFNGWEDCPEEIAQSSLNECRLFEVTDVAQATAKVRVEVDKTLQLTEIGRELPVVGQAGGWFDWMDNRRTWMARSGRFTHLSYNLESDVGAWAVIEKRDERDYLILYGEWSWHTDYFHADNRALSEQAIQSIQRIDALRKERAE